MLINIRVSELISNTNNNIPLAILVILALFIPYNNLSPYTKTNLNYDIANIFFVSSNNWDNNIVNINPSSNFDFNFIFGNIDALFEEQKVSLIIECNGGHAINLYTDAFVGYTDSLVLEEEFAKSNILGSDSL